MRTLWVLVAAGTVFLLAGGCGDGGDKPGLFEYGWQALIPGPGEEGFDEQLALSAKRRDRQFHVFHALPTGLNAEISIGEDKLAERQAIEDFLLEDEGWDFEAYSGYRVEEVVDSWWKVAGAYAGVGIAADAYRYGTMRDQNYPKEDVDRAREHLLTGLDALALALDITGVEGVIVRGLANTNFAGAGQHEELIPLFDEQGQALPPEKTNGTWRADNSGVHPDYIWEDSCSRDMLIGWVMGISGAWEVIENDPSIEPAYTQRLRTHAGQMVRAYMTVRELGYDLEVPDADGRTTYHGYLNEHNLDRMYIPGVRNGFHTIMALGIVAALADVVDEPEVDAYVVELVEGREFATIAAENSLVINLGPTTNFSNYNMAFQGAWLALRHLRHGRGRTDLQTALEVQLYNTPGEDFQPVEFGQSFFDFTYALGMCGAAAGQGCEQDLPQAALDRGLATLRDFPAPPFFGFARDNCDAAELAAGSCIASDGVTQLTVLGTIGRNGDLIVAEALPIHLRPASNYYWRSNPYKPNGGGGGSSMFAGPDFRLAYWLGRWSRR